VKSLNKLMLVMWILSTSFTCASSTLPKVSVPENLRNPNYRAPIEGFQQECDAALLGVTIQDAARMIKNQAECEAARKSLIILLDSL